MTAYRTYNSRYEQNARDDFWDREWRRTTRSRDGFAWGAFAIGLIIGVVIF